MSQTSNLGKKRMKEHMGLGKKSTDRQADLAKERGLYHKDMTGHLHKWVTGISGRYSQGNGGKYIIYNRNLFVFTHDYNKLITVIPLPTNLHKSFDNQFKKLNKILVEAT